MNVGKIKTDMTNLSIYELFAVIELSRQEICHRHIKEYDSCSNCPLSSYVCRNLYKRLLWMAEKERNE
nr:MAG TPA: hypothetical protein [Caudoviricetes sp.]